MPIYLFSGDIQTRLSVDTTDMFLVCSAKHGELRPTLPFDVFLVLLIFDCCSESLSKQMTFELQSNIDQDIQLHLISTVTHAHSHLLKRHIIVITVLTDKA